MFAAKIITLDFAKIELFENYVIAHVHENVTIDQEHFALFKNLFAAYFKEKPYVYISDRSQAYNVNPTAYIHFEFSTILKGVAIVTKGKISTLNAQFEQKFMAKPFRIFETVEDAIDWTNLVCNTS